MTNIFKGLITAIITPFKDGKIDFTALATIVERQVEAKVDGIVVAGSTGEGNNLTAEEYSQLIKTAVELTSGRLPVIVGCCSTSTDFALQLASKAQELSADGLMLTIPPYVKPTQEGVYQHFKAIHDATNLPIIIYATPGRTGTNVTDETILRLAQLPRIIALKDSGTDLERPLRLSAKLLGSNFNLLTADDPVALAYNAQGGVGCVSAIGNIAPKLCKQVQVEWKKGNIAEALKIQQELAPLYNALFNESNPIAVKYAAHYLGLCTDEIRLPLTEATPESKAKVKEALKALDLK